MVDLTLGDRVLDYGVNALHTDCDKIHVCSAVATDYASVLTNSRGNKNFGTGNAFGLPAAGLVGRKVTSAAITDGVITSSGTVSRWAAVDSVNSRLLAEGNLTGGVAVTTGETFTLGAIAVRIPGTAASALTTWDPAALGSGMVLSGGNLVATTISTTNAFCQSTSKYGSGKKYCEIAFSGAAFGTSSWIFALVRATSAFPAGYVWQSHNNDWYVNNVDSGVLGTQIISGYTLAAAVDFDNNRIWTRSNIVGEWNQNASADPVTNVGGADISAARSGSDPFVCLVNLTDTAGQVGTVNFGTIPGAVSNGNGSWFFTPPTGYTNW